jgi:signal transduction histidine kinase
LAIEKLKTKLAADLHDNIGSGLTEISILSELTERELNNGSKNTSKNLKSISETARELIDNMSDIVWVVNPKRDSLHDLIIRLKSSYNEVLTYMGISMKTTNLDKLENVKLPMEYRQNLYLIFKEGINNSLKHSRCDKIFLEANVRGEVLEMILKDNGIGLETSEKIYGNGVRNMEARAHAIGGKLKWKSSGSSGTNIIFVGKIDGANKLFTSFKRLLIPRND